MDYRCEAEFVKGKYNVRIMRPVTSEKDENESVRDRILEIKAILEQFKQSENTETHESL